MPAESYMVPLRRAYEKPRTRRSNVAVKEVFDFLYKHTRKKKEDIIIAKEVNEFIWKRGIQKPPRRVAISIREKEGKVYVFLKDSKEIENFFNKAKVVKENKSLKDKVTEIKENIQNPTANKTETKKVAEKKTETKKPTVKEKASPAKEVASSKSEATE
jgi:large subunit ribosomal protein L31e